MDKTEAREALTRWSTAHSQRDGLFRAAHTAGISKAEIHHLTGVARTTIDRILRGEAMTTHTAAITTHPADVTGDYCDIAVIVDNEDGTIGDQIVLPATPLPVRTDDPDVLGNVAGVAATYLSAMGWHVTGKWETADNALYAPVKRGPKVNDSEMRQAVIRELAQYILRGRLHTKRPAHADAQILDRARGDLAEMAAWDYTFPGDTPESIAAAANETADWQQNHNLNWDQWAFGH